MFVVGLYSHAKTSLMPACNKCVAVKPSPKDDLRLYLNEVLITSEDDSVGDDFVVDDSVGGDFVVDDSVGDDSVGDGIRSRLESSKDVSPRKSTAKFNSCYVLRESMRDFNYSTLQQN